MDEHVRGVSEDQASAIIDLVTGEALKQRVVPGYPTTFEINDLCGSARAILAMPEPSFRWLTKTLQAIDYQARCLLDPSRRSVVDLIALGGIATALRRRRRDVLHDHLRVFLSEHSSATIGNVFSEIVQPLLDRPWIPWLLYRPSGQVNRLIGAPLEPTNLKPEFLSGVMANDRMSQLNELVNLVKDLPGHAHHAARFLQTAVAHHEERDRLPLYSPVLFVEDDGTAAYLADVLFLASSPETAGTSAANTKLVSESLEPAIKASGYLSGPPFTLAIEDYPGGGSLQNISEFEGLSAGLPIAAALLAVQGSLAWEEDAIGSAGVTDDGSLIRLNDPVTLTAKAKVAALSGKVHFVVAKDEDVAAIEEGIEQARELSGNRHDLKMVPVPITSLDEARSILLTDLYDEEHKRLAALAIDESALRIVLE